MRFFSLAAVLVASTVFSQEFKVGSLDKDGLRIVSIDPLPGQVCENGVCPQQVTKTTQQECVNGGCSLQVNQQAQAASVVTKRIGSAIAELNSIRARRGLPALVEDPSLTSYAYRKASIQANRGAMYHPGGSMGGARFEGVGMGQYFTTCYADIRGSHYAGAATVVGRNGQRYHCLLVR